jgi:hypothetical protein
VIYLLESLVEQSLVTAGPDADGGGVRYGMLEPVRQYALERLEESGEEEYRVRSRHAAYYLEGLSSISASEGDLERAARLWGAAEAILEKIEVISYPHAADRSLNEEQLAAARESLDERVWEEAWAEGRAMTTEEAVAYALTDQDPESPRSEGQREARRA